MTIFNNTWFRKQPIVQPESPVENARSVQVKKSDYQKNSEWENYKEKMGFAAGFFISLGGCFLALHYYDAKPLPPINIPLVEDESITTKALSILGICIGIPSLIYLLTPSKATTAITKRSVNVISIKKPNEVDLKPINTSYKKPEPIDDGLSDTKFLEDEIIALFEEKLTKKKKKMPILIPSEHHVVGNPNSLNEDYDTFIQFIRDKSFHKTSSSIITYLETIRDVHSFNENQVRVLDAIMTSIKEQLTDGNISVNDESYQIITGIFKGLSDTYFSVSSMLTIDLSPKTDRNAPVHETINDEEYVLVKPRDLLDSFFLIGQ